MGGDDLITLAARRGMLDEATARATLRHQEPSPELLVDSGLLTPDQVRDLTEPVPEDVAAALEDPAGRLGRYVRLRELGRGGFGTVWLAWDPSLRRRVALKVLRGADDEEIARFHREARLAATLSHPNIAAVYEIGEAGDERFIALQYVDGQTLDRLRLAPNEALAALRDAARAVDHAHRARIIHRDVKPQNLMLDRDGRLVVLDFPPRPAGGGPGGPARPRAEGRGRGTAAWLAR